MTSTVIRMSFMSWLRDHHRNRRSHRSGSGPSRTSQAVALTRSDLTRPHTPDGDPGAQRKLCAGMRTVSVPGLLPSLAARTRFFDEQVLAAISAGVRQIVILGAGYDDRALRFRSPGVRFFELDHPATQADKASRLQAIDKGTERLALVPADFRHDDVAAVLDACGHDAGQMSLFICEGLLVYLDQPTVVRLLTGLRAVAADHSTLAASLATHPEGMNSERVAEMANARRRTGEIEPWRTILPASAHLGLLAGAGWQVTSHIDAVQLDAGARPGRSLLVTAAIAARH
jgi:methyltransferase (TIGR00027 family)